MKATSSANRRGPAETTAVREPGQGADALVHRPSKTEVLFRQIADNLGDGLWLGAIEPGKPAEGLYANAAFGRIFDLSAEDLARLDETWFERVHPSDRPRVLEARQRFRGQPDSGYDIEYRIVHSNGTTGWVWAKGFALHDEQGRFSRVAVLARDITERVSREQRYRNLVEQSLQGIMVVQGPPPRIAFANPLCAEMTGYALDEMLSFSLEDYIALIYPDDREQLFARLADHLSGRDVPQAGEFRIVRRDGEVREIRYSASTVLYGGVPSIQVAFLDISDLKQAEEALRRAHDGLERQVQEQTAELSAAVEHLQQEVAERERVERGLARAHRLLLALNRVSTRMQAEPDVQSVLAELGSTVSAEGLLSSVLLLDEARQVLSVYHVSLRPGAVERFEQLAGTPLIGYSFPVGWQPCATVVAQKRALYVRDRGTDLAGILAQGTPEVAKGILEAFEVKPNEPAIWVPLIAEGRMLGILTVAGSGLEESDVPALQILADQTANTLERLKLTRDAAEVAILRQVDRFRSELLANVSHEIRTPLGLIDILSSSLLMEDVSFDSQVQREFLQGIREATERLALLVDNLLEQGRLEAGRLHLVRRAVDVAEIVRAVVPRLVARSPAHTLALELEENLVLEGDAAQLERVLVNLVGNAVKYSPNGGTIRVGGHARAGQVLLSVSDEGIGIAEEEYERIFERFYRIDNEWTRKIPGIGIGLPLCRGIVTAHGGRLWVESRLGVGSTFHVLLPTQANLVPDDVGKGDLNAGQK